MSLNSLLSAFNRKPCAAQGPRVRVAVIGAGRMGQHHLRHLSRHPRAQLMAIVDEQRDRADLLARRYKVRSESSIESLKGNVDAVVISTPTHSHAAIGRLVLAAGISCLIEKPIASTVEEANELTALAERQGVVLQVGHIERFNSAVIEATKFIKDPKFIEVNRLGPYDPRVADVGVVMDLMIHDLDIVLFLVGQDVTKVEAFGAKVLSNHEDIAKVRLQFANGCIADLSASRISLKKYRCIRVFQNNAYLSIDYAAPQLSIYRKKTEVVKSLSDIQILKPKLSKKDPLSLELDHFLRCVQEKKVPLVTGRHGRDALQLAKDVLANLQVHA